MSITAIINEKRGLTKLSTGSTVRRSSTSFADAMCSPVGHLLNLLKKARDQVFESCVAADPAVPIMWSSAWSMGGLMCWDGDLHYTIIIKNVKDRMLIQFLLLL